jgi:hypothetical protein
VCEQTPGLGYKVCWVCGCHMLYKQDFWLSHVANMACVYGTHKPHGSVQYARTAGLPHTTIQATVLYSAPKLDTTCTAQL